MSHDRSDFAYEIWWRASERFDYFVTGLTGALTAYVGQHVEPVRLGANAPTVQLAALAVLAGSTILGLLRIEAVVSALQAGWLRLSASESRGNLHQGVMAGHHFNAATGDVLSSRQMLELAEISEQGGRRASEASQRWLTRATAYYHWRNRTLLVGFVLLVLSRLLPAYGK